MTNSSVEVLKFSVNKRNFKISVHNQATQATLVYKKDGHAIIEEDNPHAIIAAVSDILTLFLAFLMAHLSRWWQQRCRILRRQQVEATIDQVPQPHLVII